MTRRRRRGPRALAQVPMVAGALACVVPPLLLGGAPGWSVPLIASLALLAFAAALVTGGLFAPQRRDALVLAPLFLTGVQAIPWPRGLVAFFAPQRLALVAPGELAEDPAFVPLSLDPAGTFEALVVGVAIVAAYGLGRAVATKEGREKALLLALASPVLVALIGFAHALAGAEKLYGVHAPRYAAPALLAPLLNNNHLGGFLAFGAALATGLALGASRERRTLHLLAAGVCGLGALLAVSRGAVLSLVVGWTLIAGLALRRRGRNERGQARRSERWQVLAPLALAATTFGAGAYVGLAAVVRDFEAGDYSKLALAQRSLGLAFEHPVLGIGRGAFRSVFAEHDVSNKLFTHPENIGAQWLVEWGVLAVLLALPFLKELGRGLRSQRLAVAGAAAALLALVLHDTVDFALEMAGVAPVAAFTFGVVLTRGEAGSRRRSRSWRPLLATVLGLAAALAVLGPGVPARRPDALAAALRQAAVGPSAEARVKALAEEARWLHPRDPEIAMEIAFALESVGDPNVLRWLNRSMSLAPGWPAPHLLAASWLARRGAFSQALLELREAEARGTGASRTLLCRFAEELSVTELVRAIPPDVMLRRGVVERLAGCVDARRLEELDAWLLARDPDALKALLRRARRTVDTAPELAEADVERVLALAPEREDARVLAAELVARREGAAAALEQLPARASTTEAVAARARFAAQAGDEAELQRQLRRLRTLAAGSARDLARAWATEGRIEEERENLGAAVRAYERAHRLDGRSNEVLLHIARLAEDLGQLRRALSAHADLCRRGREQSCGWAERRRGRLERRARSKQLPRVDDGDGE
ncbi:MAG: O-antigen ligase family protein [Myxococcota bacterium]